MTVIDSSVVIDLLADEPVATDAVNALLSREGSLAAPDILVFEVLTAFRRLAGRGQVSAWRAAVAIEDLGDIAVDLYPSLPLRERAWELRENLTAGDALFVALAEMLAQPILTKDRGLAAAAGEHAGVEAIALDTGD